MVLLHTCCMPLIAIECLEFSGRLRVHANVSTICLSTEMHYPGLSKKVKKGLKAAWFISLDQSRADGSLNETQELMWTSWVTNNMMDIASSGQHPLRHSCCYDSTNGTPLHLHPWQFPHNGCCCIMGNLSGVRDYFSGGMNKNFDTTTQCTAAIKCDGKFCFSWSQQSFSWMMTCHVDGSTFPRCCATFLALRPASRWFLSTWFTMQFPHYQWLISRTRSFVLILFPERSPWSLYTPWLRFLVRRHARDMSRRTNYLKVIYGHLWLNSWT